MFNKPWQPVPDDLPHVKELAYAAAALFVLIGIGLQWTKTAGVSAWAAMALYWVFVMLWAKRVIAYPQIFGTWSGVAEELALFIGAYTIVVLNAATKVAEDRAPGVVLDVRLSGALGLAIARILFGLCLLAFGTAHFLYVKETAALVPAWLPPNQNFWAYATGAAHAAAGLALISGLLAPLAARLVTAMFVGFGLLVWAPQLFSAPHAHISWGGNAINLALIGAAWVMADAIAAKRT